MTQPTTAEIVHQLVEQAARAGLHLTTGAQAK